MDGKEDRMDGDCPAGGQEVNDEDDYRGLGLVRFAMGSSMETRR